VVIDETIFVHTKCHVTLKTLELHGSRHTPGGAYATPPLGRIADRPVFIVMRVQSYDVGRLLAGLPTGMDGRGSCPARASISLIRVSRKSLCEILFPLHVDKRM
jgi:hypothetical protein